MSVRYSENLKKEVVKAYMIGDKSISQLSIDFNIAKSTIRDWAKKDSTPNLSKVFSTVLLLLL